MKFILHTQRKSRNGKRIDEYGCKAFKTKAAVIKYIEDSHFYAGSQNEWVFNLYEINASSKVEIKVEVLIK